MFFGESGNIFENTYVDGIVIPVNCVGVMGKGLALEAAKRYPSIVDDYKILCKNGTLKPGNVIGICLPEPPHTRIIMFPTKAHWKDPSTLDYIESGLKSLLEYVKDKHLKSVVLPQIGCGLERLKWADVYPLVKKYLLNCGTDFFVYGNLWWKSLA